MTWKGCDAAAPGDLCEGDGKCGTRSDINNCYDASYTYPPSRDVPGLLDIVKKVSMRSHYIDAIYDIIYDYITLYMIV